MKNIYFFAVKSNNADLDWLKKTFQLQECDQLSKAELRFGPIAFELRSNSGQHRAKILWNDQLFKWDFLISSQIYPEWTGVWVSLVLKMGLDLISEGTDTSFLSWDENNCPIFYYRENKIHFVKMKETELLGTSHINPIAIQTAWIEKPTAINFC